MNRETLSYRWWKLRRAVESYFRHPARTARTFLFGALVIYLGNFWYHHSATPTRTAHWLRQQWPRPVTVESDSSYEHAFDRAMQELRADRRVRLIRYDFPLGALRYQQATAGG